MILNLVSNACDAVDEKRRKSTTAYLPTLTLATVRHDDRVHIKVRDNGDGIPEEIREKVFNPFFTTKATDQGTGLGLSLSNDIVREHGGEIAVDSAPGEYTEMTISLPVSLGTGWRSTKLNMPIRNRRLSRLSAAGGFGDGAGDAMLELAERGGRSWSCRARRSRRRGCRRRGWTYRHQFRRRPRRDRESHSCVASLSRCGDSSALRFRARREIAAADRRSCITDPHSEERDGPTRPAPRHGGVRYIPHQWL